MKTVTIGFSTPIGFMPGAEIIKFWQGGTRYSHVYLVVHSSYTGLNLVYQASHGMVNCLPYERFKTTNKIIKEFTLDIDDKDLQNCIRIAQSLLGSPYGFMGLLRLAAARLLDRVLSKEVNKWGDGLKTLHCSEFICALFPELAKEVGLSPDRIEPIHLYKVLDTKFS